MNCVLLLIGLVSGGIYDPGAGSFIDEAVLFHEAFDLGDSCYRVSDYEGAAQFYLEGLRAQPWDDTYIYNLSCCFGLLGRADLAALYLRRAWNAGFRNMPFILGDTDFDRVRTTEPFSSLVDSLSEVSATEAALRGETIVFRTTGPFECRVNTPEGYDGTETLPLLLGLHGIGGTPEGFMRLWNVAREFPCIMAVPQAPYPFDTGEGMGYSWFEDGFPMVSSRDYVLAVLDSLEARYSVGEVYLFGYSQGAGMALMTGLHAPERFNGVAPFSGWLPEEVTDQEIQAAAGLPVRIVHGEQDGAVTFDNAIQTVSVLAAHDYDVRLLSFQGEHRFEADLFRQILEEFLGADE